MTLRFLAKTRFASLLAVVMCATAVSAAAPPVNQPHALGGPRPDASTIEQWQARKFGLFIHFGLYSMLGGEWQGKRIDKGYSEQILANAPLPGDQYAAMAATFDPVKFDADAIVALAKAAGMKFIVVTAKHHDGFNMFHTAQTKYNIVDATPFKRDVVKELADACRRGGLAFGVYYSTIDWHHPGGNTYIEGNSNPITAGQEAFNVAQLKELLGHYGPIAEIWFDMGKPTPAQSAHFARTVHELQPQTMVSGRVWNYQGDFTVMGDNAEPDVAVEEPWQSPASIFPQTWGYRAWQQRDDLPGKVRENIARLVRVVSAGGNYILNIGPEGDGSVVPYEADVLHGIGAWMKVNGEAIYGTKAQPFAALPFGHATVGEGKLYLFVEKVPGDGVLRLPGVVDTTFAGASLLGAQDGRRAEVRQDNDGASVDVNALLNGQKDRFIPVIALAFHGRLNVRPVAATADPDGTLRLQADKAEHFLNYNGYGYEDPATVYKLRWHAALPAGRYIARIRYQAPTKPVLIDLIVDGHSQSLTLPAGKGAATASVEVDRDKANEPYAMRVEITPRAPFLKGQALPVKVEAVSLSTLAP
jgi:alpha-L-fucosidase